MPKRYIALMGYIGEAIVEFWLKEKFQDYLLVSQLRPVNVPSRGGPYLDFGLIKDNKLHFIFEVKGQDYILDKNIYINKSLVYIWSKYSDWGQFQTQDGNSIEPSVNLKAYLVLLVPPNEDGLNFIIGNNNINRIILFKDIWDKLLTQINYSSFENIIKIDIEEVLHIFKEPKQGNTLIDDFIKKRGKLDI